MLRETERKYEVAADVRLPAPSELVSGGSVQSDEQVLTATYFDTPDLRLAQVGVTLRRRVGGTDAGWHLKLPVEKDVRDEVRLPLGRSVRRPPATLVALTRVYTRGAELGPVAELRTERHRHALANAEDDGRELVEIVDDQVRATTMGTETTTLSWREVEVELLEAGSAELLDDIEKALLTAGATRSPAASKLAKLLGDRVTPASPPPLGKKSSAGGVILAYLWTQAAELRRHDPLVRRNAPDAVHQMRVASRRMRSVLQANRRIVDRERAEPLIEELKWLGGELAAARDSEVMAERFENLVAELPPELVLGPVQGTLTREFEGRQRDALAAGIAALNGDRYLALLDMIDGFFADPPVTERAGRPAKRELRRGIERAWRRLRGRMATVESSDVATERDVALHEARKAAKRLRYSAEAAEPVFGKPAQRMRKQLKGVQSLLGTHQDTVVARAELRAIGASAFGQGLNTFTFGVMHGAEKARADEAEREIPDAWKRLNAKKIVGWLEE